MTLEHPIIIAGSGPTDRDGNNSMMTNNSLKLLAEGLVKNGIASLRYDKRGIGKSTNVSISVKDLRFDHYINDVSSWVEKLKSDTRFSEIIIIGHSEGALIGSVAAKNESVDKFVSIAGSGYPIDKTIREQLKAQSPVVLEQANTIMDSLLQEHLVNNVPAYLNSLFRASVQPYMISWMKYDPCTELGKLNIPVLILQGTTDLQVKVEDANLLKEAKADAELVLIDGMNHIFRNADLEPNSNMASYYDPSLPVNKELIQKITKFILE